MSNVPKEPPLRVLPSDLITERAVLGALLNDQRHLHLSRPYLGDGDVFYLADHQRFYSAMLAVMDAGLDLRHITVHRQLASIGQEDVARRLGIMELQSEGYGLSGSGDELVAAARALRELYTKREVYTQLAAAAMSARGNGSLDELQHLYQQIGLLLSGSQVVSSSEHIGLSIDKAVEDILSADPNATGPAGVPTGLGKLDQATGGWMPEEYILLIARPGQGKTALALKWIEGAAMSGVPVAFISLEMSGEANAHRLLSSRSHVPYSVYRRKKHRDGRPLSEDEKIRTFEAGQQIKQMPIYFYVKPSFDVHDVCYFIKDEIRRHGIGLVVIDYLGLLVDRETKGGNDNARVGAVSRAIRASCKQTGIPHIVLHQMNRQAESRAFKEGEDARPRIGDIRDSGQVEQDANIIIGLYRDDYYKDKRAQAEAAGGDWLPPPKDNIMEAEILKSRNDETVVLEFWCDMATNRIMDSEPYNFDQHKPAQSIRSSLDIPADQSIGSFENNARQIASERSNDTPF